MHLRVRLADVVQDRPGCCLIHAARLTGGVTGLLAWALLTRSARCSPTEGARGTESWFPGASSGWTALRPAQPMMACQRGFAVLPHCHLVATRPFDGKGLLQGQEAPAKAAAYAVRGAFHRYKADLPMLGKFHACRNTPRSEVGRPSCVTICVQYP